MVLLIAANSRTVIFPVDFKKNGHIVDDVCCSLYLSTQSCHWSLASTGNAQYNGKDYLSLQDRNVPTRQHRSSLYQQDVDLQYVYPRPRSITLFPFPLLDYRLCLTWVIAKQRMTTFTFNLMFEGLSFRHCLGYVIEVKFRDTYSSLHWYRSAVCRVYPKYILVSFRLTFTNSIRRMAGWGEFRLATTCEESCRVLQMWYVVYISLRNK